MPDDLSRIYERLGELDRQVVIIDTKVQMIEPAVDRNRDTASGLRETQFAIKADQKALRDDLSAIREDIRSMRDGGIFSEVRRTIETVFTAKNIGYIIATGIIGLIAYGIATDFFLRIAEIYRSPVPVEIVAPKPLPIAPVDSTSADSLGLIQ